MIFCLKNFAGENPTTKKKSWKVLNFGDFGTSNLI